MSAERSFQTLKDFFETRRASRQAMSSIQEGVEIGIVIGGIVDCALYRQGEQPIVEARAAQSPDVVFHISPESVDVLAERSEDDIGDIGVNLLKEVLAGNIQIKVPGRILNIVNRGYLEMVRKGGAPVASFLRQKGLSSVPKILNTIKQMKR